jgi:coproporphyrinogen III oxidase
MNIKKKQQVTAQWFQNLRDLICAEFEKIEIEFWQKNSPKNSPKKSPKKSLGDFTKKVLNPGKFVKKTWKRQDANESGNDGGFGEMSVMKGIVFEKVGVNFSKVYGHFSEEFRQQIPGTKKSSKFWASGISLVAHMCSPLVPAVHLNTRFICTEKSWFGGGSDLNPVFEYSADTKDFHQALKQSCIKTDGTSYDYEKFKKWCDEYFFIKHRGVSRGVGGIFYDYLNSGNFTSDFEFTQNVGLAFLEIFPKLVRRHMFKKWSQEQRQYQLKKRGLYAEFNLIYDRGTKFGLMTGGNAEAILMSLPPLAMWE